MIRFWQAFYNVIVVPILWIIFRVLALVDKKAARALHGRKDLLNKLGVEISKLPAANKRVWFHSSSMGEFEQAKPIIAELKRRRPDVEIIVSFFSPSGYEHSRTYKPARIITYIPFDSWRNAITFVSMIEPTAAVFIRYDIWPNHLWALKAAGIRTFLVSATMNDRTMRKLPVIKQFHRHLYNTLDYILPVSENDRRTFSIFELQHPVVEVVGDTRFDQVRKRSEEAKGRPMIVEQVLFGKRILVMGSSWKEDEDVMLPACLRLLRDHDDLLIVLVPHEPTMEHLEQIENDLNGGISSIRFSTLASYRNERMLIVDSVGILMPLYQHAHVAFVGGSFRGGVHNVLEPAAYGIPILIGPVHKNSQEAIQLVNEGGAFVGGDVDEMHTHLLALLWDEPRRVEAGKRAAEFVCRNVGATGKVLKHLEAVL